MKTLPKILKSKTKIRFQDCDPFNHLNNAAYINYLINAREDQLIQYYDIDIYKMGKTLGKSWVVGSNQIAYLRPAFLMEEVVIDSQLINFSNSSLQVELRMWNHDKTELKAVMWSSFVHFNLIKLKTEVHTEELMQLFNAVLNPVKQTSFETRAQQLKAKKQVI
ncbi:acyl-CoA thioesterase [Pontimicrobium sp. IMCC45349]|uniref:acyl-CoA thioesterase n=1 Tax=Pontimicrobium sp. IMCC45349 TaxID=3391574 RepID=UPI0039A30535